MEHDEAVNSQAAERYASHELSPADRTAFEEHFFDCLECADTVRFELAFAANVRAISREMRAQEQGLRARAGSWGKWLGWLRLRPVAAFSFAANLVLAAGLGYALLSHTHQAARPRLIAAYFAPGPAKGAETVHPIAAGETIYQVRFDILGRKNPSYAYEILDGAGNPESSGSLKAPPGEDDSLNLQIPVENLPAGVHTLVVRGQLSGEIVSWSKFSTAR
jgi:hypothetical protein